MQTLTLMAPAKVNRFLHIVGRREDGYHELQTIFHLINYSDTLHFTVRKDSKIILFSDFFKIPKNHNLIYRAAKLLQITYSKHRGVNIVLDKKIPVGAGLGGGSSDAATTLLALNTLWGLNLSLEKLAKLGAKLGADVPVFVQGYSAWGEGIGEQLTPMKLPDVWFVIIVPPVQVPTVKIFCDKQLTHNTPICKMSFFLLESGHNDCESVVRRLYPEVEQVINWLTQFGQPHMTGSGGSVFFPCSTEEQAQDIVKKIPAEWFGFVARGLNYSPVHVALKVV